MIQPPRTVLVVDDDIAVTTSLELLLKQAGYQVRSVAGPDAALARIEESPPDLVLQDMNFSRSTEGEEGLALLERIKTVQPNLPVILITAWGSVPLAVRGIKAGASDFVTKPWSHEQILHSVRTTIGLADARRSPLNANPPPRSELDSRFSFQDIIGEDPALVRVLDLVGRVAATDAPVLITGESGTGKELVAEAIWRNSGRVDEPFVKVNLGGIPTTLFESEMFGHVRGAFTDARSNRVGRFEAADGGTLFLDEIGDLEAPSQVKLLRVLQDRTFERVGSSNSQTVDVRIISATNRDLPTLIEAGDFREDLLYRLNLIAIQLPSLRERPSDIPLLSRHFLAQLAQRYNRPVPHLTDEAIDWLRSRPWPGNVRQLRQTIERTLLLAKGDKLDRRELTLADEMQPVERSKTRMPRPGSMTLEEMEREMIRQTLDRYEGNVSQAADALGLSRGALYRRLEKYGLLP